MRHGVQEHPGEEEWADMSRGNNNARQIQDDEQSYRTHYSDSSMGLSKRQSKKLSLVAFVPLGGGAEGEDEARAIESEEEESYHLRRSSRHSRDGGSSRSTRSKSGEPTFDHSSSTHKTRGSGPSEGGWRRSELSVITDVKEERDQSPVKRTIDNTQVASPTRPSALSPENAGTPTAASGSDMRNRRRERLAKLTRSRESPKPQSNPATPKAQSPRKRTPKAKTPKSPVKKLEADHRTPSSRRLANKTTEKQAAFFPESDNTPVQVEPKEMEEDRRPPSTKRVSSLKPKKERKFFPEHAKTPEPKSESLVPNAKPDRVHRRYEQTSTICTLSSEEPEDNETDERSEVKNRMERDAALSPREHTTSSPYTKARVASPRERQVSPRQGSHPHQQQDHQSYSFGSGHDIDAETVTSNESSLYYNGELSREEEDADYLTTNRRSLSPVVEINTLSSDSSVATGNIHMGNCSSQCVKNTRFIARRIDRIPGAGYTQKCTSFVTGVWESCTAIRGYETENNGNLLRLEMMAEQSASTIYQTGKKAGGRESPDAFQRSREIMSKRDNDPSDSSTQEDTDGPLGLMETLSKITMEFQNITGTIQPSGPESEQSMMDDMRNIFESVNNSFYSPHHTPYEQTEETGRVFEYHHGVTKKGKGNMSNDTFNGNRNMRLTNSEVTIEEVPSADSSQDEEDDPQPEAARSIYTSVVKGPRDRRSMVMELQKRRLKNIKQRKETWIDTKANSGNDETAKLRRLYLGMYDKIHDEEKESTKPDPQAPADASKTAMKTAEVKTPEEAHRGDDGSKHELASDDILEDDGENAVVWAASDCSEESSPEGQTESGQVDAVAEAIEDKSDDIHPEPEAVSSLLVEAPSLQHMPSLLSASSSESCHLLADERPTSAAALDSDKGEGPISQQTSTEVDKPASRNPVDHEQKLPLSRFVETDMAQLHVEGAESPSPDKTISEDCEEADGDSACANVEKSAHTTSTAEMDELVSSFLVSPSSNPPMQVAVTTEAEVVGEPHVDTVNTKPTDAPPLDTIEPQPSHSTPYESEQSQSTHYEDVVMNETTPNFEYPAVGDSTEPSPSLDDPTIDDSTAPIQSFDDPTVADSTIMSVSSRLTHDMSMAETIVSVSHSVSQSTKSEEESYYSSSSSSTERSMPAPPSEIAQLEDPVSDHQVLYQISEEEEEELEDQDHYEFEPQNDVPFDQDMTLEDYKKKQSRKGGIGRWVKVVAFLAWIYYLGVGGEVLRSVTTILAGVDDVEGLGDDVMTESTTIYPVEPTEDLVMEEDVSIDEDRAPSEREEEPSTRVEVNSSEQERKEAIGTPLVDGVCLSDDSVCYSQAFAVGQSLNPAEMAVILEIDLQAEEYRRAWVEELKAALEGEVSQNELMDSFVELQ